MLMISSYTVAFKPSNTGAKEQCIQHLVGCVEEIHKWMSANMLKLNDDKTEFIMFGIKHQLSKAESALTRMAIGNSKVQPADQIHNLGFFMDNTLKNQVHINNLTSLAFNQMLNIRRICSKLDHDTTRTIIQALVMSKLDYCKSLLPGSANYQLKKIQRIQNMAHRIVCNLHKCDHVTPSKHNLHWLMIPQRIQFKIACLMYKCIKGQAPKYLYRPITI